MESLGVKKKKFKMCDTKSSSLTDLNALENSKLESTSSHGHVKSRHNLSSNDTLVPKQNQVGNVMLFGVPIVSLVMDGKERLCLAQISSTLLKEFSYNEIHNRRVALGITCIQCTPVQLEILRRAGAMPVTSRRCGMITRREAERLCQSFLGDHAPPQLPENFAFEVFHQCAWGCRGSFVPSRYNSSRAKCIRCSFCQLFFSPNKFIFHSHRLPDSRYVQPDAANFNSWRRHLKLCGDPQEEVSPSTSPSPSNSHHNLYPKLSSSSSITSTSTSTNSTIASKESTSVNLNMNRSIESISINHSSNSSSLLATSQIVHAWEDTKAMFNGGTRKRLLAAHSIPSTPSSPHGSARRQSASSSSSQLHNSHLNSKNNENSTMHHSVSSPSSSGTNHHSNTSVNSSSRATTPQTPSHMSRLGQPTPNPNSNPLFAGHHHPCDLPPIGIGIGNNNSSTATGFSHGHSHNHGHGHNSPSSSSIPPSLLSPSSSPSSSSSIHQQRLEAIWNPGISMNVAAAVAAAAASRQCQQMGASNNSTSGGSPNLPQLPFHPLSIPWLRRPLFPFSHPFGPTCKLFGETGNCGSSHPNQNSNPNSNGITSPSSSSSPGDRDRDRDQVGNSSSGNRSGSGSGQVTNPHQSSNNSSNTSASASAFKPVGQRNAEQLFSWLSNNHSQVMGMRPSASSMSMPIPMSMPMPMAMPMSMSSILPEDLSLNPACPPLPIIPTDFLHHQHNQFHPHSNPNSNAATPHLPIQPHQDNRSIYGNNVLLAAAVNAANSNPNVVVPSSTSSSSSSAASSSSSSSSTSSDTGHQHSSSKENISLVHPSLSSGESLNSALLYNNNNNNNSISQMDKNKKYSHNNNDYLHGSLGVNSDTERQRQSQRRRRGNTNPNPNVISNDSRKRTQVQVNNNHDEEEAQTEEDGGDSDGGSEQEDEENVDIESTDVGAVPVLVPGSDECPVSMWMMHSINNNNNNNNNNIDPHRQGSGKLKRVLQNKEEDEEEEEVQAALEVDDHNTLCNPEKIRDDEQDETGMYIGLHSETTKLSKSTRTIIRINQDKNYPHHRGHDNNKSKKKKKRLWDCDRRVVSIKTVMPVSVTETQPPSKDISRSNSTTPELLSLTD